MFFWLSKLAWLAISPGNLLVILLLLAWLLCITQWETAGHRLLGVTTLLILSIAVLPVGTWLLFPLEQRFPVAEPGPQPDGIVVLGGSFSMSVSDSRQQVELNATSERLLAFLELAALYPQARLVFTGGSGNPANQELREADLAEELFAGLGLDPTRVEFERDSRNTYENARNTLQLVQPRAGENWLLISSAFHMPRAMGVFCHQGWDLRPYPVDYRTFAEPGFRPGLSLTGSLETVETALHEWVGLLAYRVTGKTDRLFPGPDQTCQTPASPD
ncbi:MAG: YdcF family protein [Gammaproteobacteria bacterium]|nr:YdcF family protein [Pseudomonadales bacterium]